MDIRPHMAAFQSIVFEVGYDDEHESWARLLFLSIHLLRRGGDTWSLSWRYAEFNSGYFECTSKPGVLFQICNL